MSIIEDQKNSDIDRNASQVEFLMGRKLPEPLRTALGFELIGSRPRYMVAVLLDTNVFGEQALDLYRDKLFPMTHTDWPEGVRVMDREEFAKLWNENQLTVPAYWCTWAWLS